GRIAGAAAPAAEEPILHPPGIHAHRLQGRGEGRALPPRGPDPGLDSLEQTAARPAQMAVHPRRRVLEPVDLLQEETGLVQTTQHGPPAPGPQIDREMERIGHAVPSLLRLSRLPGAPPPAAPPPCAHGSRSRGRWPGDRWPPRPGSEPCRG